MKFLLLAVGNPGERYAQTRHNLGVLVLGHLIKLYDSNFNLDFMKTHNQYVFTYNNHEFIAQWNISYVNTTGSPMGLFMNKNNIKPDQLMVFVDNLELPFEQWKYSFGFGTFGHNGLKSIKNMLGEQCYHRISLGIDRPEKEEISNYVLGKFSHDQLKNTYNIAYDLYRNNILCKLMKIS
jgi:PTH1 family peptidyl-tRNA hydrolase